MTPSQAGTLQPSEDRHRGLAAMIAMMGLYFLVLISVGILRPIRNAIALDGLGQTDFYKVYLVSGLVIVFVPLLNWLSDRVPWRRLIPAVAIFFALNLLIFRAVYVEGSTAFGLVFYGWYDLFAAALVTQLFMVTQLFFHARLAKRAYPLVIAGGSLGATTGGAITGFLAETVGTPNLLLLAAGLIATFSVVVTMVWSMEGMVPERPRPARSAPATRGGLGVRAIFGNRQVILIASLVLITILVKQLVDYQFNTITKEVFETLDAISSFQGKFNAATQWLPIVVLLAMRRPLQRWGVGLVVLILPVSMLLTNVGLVLFWGLWAAVAAKGAETSFRYSAERAGREILYVPVPDEIKLKAKAYIDVAVEKGVGKLSSALLIFLLLTRLEYQQVAWVGGALSVVWIVMALAVRREYVRSLASAVENRFASLHGVFASLQDASTLKVLRDALRGDERQVAFALDLLDQAPEGDAEPLAEELTGLLDHPSAAIRRRTLDLLGGLSELPDPARVEAALGDPKLEVREAAVRAWVASSPDPDALVVERLLESEDVAIRIATLSCLAREEIEHAGRVPARVGAESGPAAGAEHRIERALVAGVLRPPDAAEVVGELLDDPDPVVVSTALRSAGLLGDPSLHSRLTDALADPRTREAARDALAQQGTGVLPVLTEALLDEGGVRTVRRHIPGVLARLPDPATVHALVDAVLATETDQILDHRAIKALSKLRASNPELDFPADRVRALLQRSVDAARLLVSVDDALRRVSTPTRSHSLLQQAVREAWEERREEAFRCLGLLHEPGSIHRAFMSVTRGETVSRANALEWLESTVGFHDFRMLGPVLDPDDAAPPSEELADLLERLVADEDRWVARCARRVGAEMGLPGFPTPSLDGETAMDPIETVFLLQQVDVLRDARSAHLALLGSIAEEEDTDTGTVLLREGEPPDALYVVVRGEVTLEGSGGEISMTDGEAFGTWALVDDVPSMVRASAARPTRLLRIGREEFLDLLADHPELAIGMLQGLARRLRSLVL